MKLLAFQRSCKRQVGHARRVKVTAPYTAPKRRRTDASLRFGNDKFCDRYIRKIVIEGHPITRSRATVIHTIVRSDVSIIVIIKRYTIHGKIGKCTAAVRPGDAAIIRISHFYIISKTAECDPYL